MGTRNLTAVMIDGKYKIAQYGQWDGYPSGQGLTILSFLKEQGNIDSLRESLKKVRFMEAEERDKEFIKEYEKNAPDWSSDPDNRTEEQKRWFRTYSTRDLGGEILKAIAFSKDQEIILSNRIDFSGDSLFCEYAYVIDFDKGSFEIYEGFNKEPIKEGRFAGFKKEGDYEPVKLVKTYSLTELPTEKMFLSDLEPENEDVA